jgi:hypothetical protein
VRGTMKRLFVLAILGCSACESAGARTRQEITERRRKEEAALAAAKAKALAVVKVELPAPYSDADLTPLVGDAKCPEGLWALFAGQAPGSTDEEKKSNAAKRAELAKTFEGKRFVVKMRPPAIKLSPYDAPKGQFTIDVDGSIDCSDSMGHIAIAWTDTKAISPPASAAQSGNDITQNVWSSKPSTFDLAMTRMDEAQAFEKANRVALSARAVIRFEKVDNDKKLKKIGKVSAEAFGEKLGYGGGFEDWGAGRLVRAKLIALRVATEGEAKQLFEMKP